MKRVLKYHGVSNLEIKQESIQVNKTNINDIKNILGTPPVTSKFDKDVWIYIERVEEQSGLKKFGKMDIIKNNVLILELNEYGVLNKKDFYNINDMNQLKIVEMTTTSSTDKQAFIYKFMSSMRQKMNDPLNRKAIQRKKEISQR